MKKSHTPGPWKAYTPTEQDGIRKNASSYAPEGDIFRIGGNLQKGGRYVGLLFKSHPNEPDPTEADARLISAAPTSKACTKCGVVKPLGEFHKSNRSKDGLAYYCKQCNKAKYLKWAEANHEKIKAYGAKNYKENPEKIKARLAKWKEENPEKLKAAKARQYAAWRARNPIIPNEAFKYQNDKYEEQRKKEWGLANIDHIKTKSSEAINMLKDHYIARLIGISVSQATPELLELKREQLTLLRATNQLKKEMKNVE